MKFSRLYAILLCLSLLAFSSVWVNAQASGAAAGANSTCHFDGRQPHVKVTGTVADTTKAAILGATITLKCGTFRQDTHTTGDGTYAISAPAGTYQLQVEAPGFETINRSIELSASGSHSQDFELAIGRVASIVSVNESGGYVAVASTTATKSDIPLIETPQSVSVITADQMAARGVQTINQAIAYTPGVGTNTYGQDTRYDYVNIRGFDQSTYGLFRDNSRWQSGQVSGQIDPYMIQEVDVIKGPSSVLYGQNTPGGLINLVTKRPPSETTNEIMTTFGSYNRKQVQGDFGGPLGSKNLRYRLTGLFRDSDTQVNYVPDNRWFIAPALTWTPNVNTTLTILTDYQADDTGWGQFLPSQGTWQPNPNGQIDTSFFAGEPGYDLFHRKQWSIGSLFEHKFNQNVTLRNTFRHSKISYHGTDVFGAGLEEDLRTLDRFAFGNMLNLDVDTTDTQVFTQFKTGSVEHSFLVGVDYSHSNSLIVSGFAGAPSIDIYHPVYGQGTIPALFIYYNTKQPIDQTGLYFQDHIKIAKHFVATLSGREDWNKMTTDDRSAGTIQKQDPKKFSGRVGLTYLSDIGLAPYFSYSTSFLPTAGASQSTHIAYVPTEGKQFEAGLKFQPKRSNSFITASWFQVTQSNVLTPDPDPKFPFNQVQNGEVRSRGVEFEGVASLLQGLNLHASYSFLSQEVTKTTDPLVLGKRPTLIPEQNLGITGDYMISRGALAGLGFGAGVRWIGTTAGDSQNTIILPSYGLVDLSARYLFKTTEFNLTVTNLADNIYVPVCTSVSYCNYGTRRSVIGSVRYRWNSWGTKH